MTINKDGSISDVKNLKNLNPLLDTGAVRIVKSMPKWKPGKTQGKAIESKYVVPLLF